MRGRLDDLSGLRFGMWTAIEITGILKNRARVWRCVCDCGAVKNVPQSNLRGGLSTGCGCAARAATAKRSTRHGGRWKPEYSVWSNMLRRCRDPRTRWYKYYGGRGISVCERWLDFGAFLTDMGPRPSKLYSIDRIDVNGNYEPENCRWATIAEQRRNSRRILSVTAFGKTQCLTDWSRETGIQWSVLKRRIYEYNWPPELALTEKPKHGPQRRM